MVLLVMAVLVGVPVSAAAFGFLALVDELQPILYTDLPKALGFHGTPPWWPLPLLAVGGLLVGLTVQYLPGRGGHEPSGGLKASGTPTPVGLPGILLAALGDSGLRRGPRTGRASHRSRWQTGRGRRAPRQT
ncbi:hypothetical protein [Streptomyces sp. SR27]|uniref:hypothetical protein n=1 Tax=Streptomyces sp. SR27 TaxID=3076630 RepID=UPI003FA37E5B